MPAIPNPHAAAVLALTAVALFLFTRERIPGVAHLEDDCEILWTALSLRLVRSKRPSCEREGGELDQE